MNTEQKLQRLLQLCDTHNGTTKAEIQRLCADLASTSDRPASFGGDDIRWRELIERVRGFSKGLRDLADAKNALLLLGAKP